MTARIRSLRKSKGMSQEALADAAGLRGAANISELESGKGNPTLSTLTAIASALGVHLLDLFEDDRLDPRAREIFDKVKALPEDQRAAYRAILPPARD